MMMAKQPMNVSTVNAVIYDLAHDLDLTEKAWLITALRSHVNTYCRAHMTGYHEGECNRLIDQWIDVHERSAGRR